MIVDLIKIKLNASGLGNFHCVFAHSNLFLKSENEDLKLLV